jgi:hypothetical protein
MKRGGGGDNRSFVCKVENNEQDIATGLLRRKKSETMASNEGLAEELNSFFSSIFTREDGTNVLKAEDRRAAEKSGIHFMQAIGEKEDKEAKSGCRSGPRWDWTQSIAGDEIIDCLALVFSESF